MDKWPSTVHKIIHGLVWVVGFKGYVGLVSGNGLGVARVYGMMEVYV